MKYKKLSKIISVDKIAPNILFRVVSCSGMITILHPMIGIWIESILINPETSAMNRMENMVRLETR
jgi:hypothetical protein